MSKKKTQEEFIEEVNITFPNNEFTVIGEYVGSRYKVEVLHNICNETSEVYPSDFINKKYASCYKCNQRNRLLTKLEKYLIKNNLLDEYSYSKNQSILFQHEAFELTHNKCGCTFHKVLDQFYQGQYCPFCAGQRTNKTFAQYKIDKLTSDGKFIILNTDEEAIDAHDSHIRLLHTTCNREMGTSLTYFIVQNPSCTHCTKEKNAIAKRKTNGQFINELDEIYNGDFVPLDKYVTANTYINFLHKPCGNIVNQKPSSLLSLNGGCEICSMSMPESIIKNILIENSIDFTFGHKFNDCISDKNKKLPFDFTIFDGDNVKYIIEYDGQHHFHEESFGKESHIRTVKNDLIKNSYCDRNNIKLFRIPYTELKNLKSIVLDIITS